MKKTMLLSSLSCLLGMSVCINANADNFQSVGVFVKPYLLQQHLQYKAVSITNNTPAVVSLNHLINAKNKLTHLELCSASQKDCAYHSTCTEHLLPGASCLVWFKALGDHPSNNVINLQINNVNKKIKIKQAPVIYSQWSVKNSKGITNYVMKLVNNEWQTVATPLNGFARSVIIYNGDYYIGGTFTNAIKKLNGNVWQDVGDGLQGDQDTGVNSLTVFNNTIYAGGDFTRSGQDVAVQYVAHFDGSKWVPDDHGVIDGSVFSMQAYNNHLYITGVFDDPKLAHIAVLDNGEWQRAGQGFLINPAVPSVTGNDLLVFNDHLVVGASNDNDAQGKEINVVSQLVNNKWVSVGDVLGKQDGPTLKISSEVYHLASDANSDLFAAGWNVNKSGNYGDNNIYMINASSPQWQIYNKTSLFENHGITSLLYNDNALYVGGDFATADGDHVVTFDSTKQQWVDVGNVPSFVKGAEFVRVFSLKAVPTITQIKVS